MKKQKRYSALDSLRGFALINMIIYHALWDVVYLFHINIPWYKTNTGFVWQQAICWMFILLSGFCWMLGSKKLKRGLQVLIFSCIISIVTMFLMPESAVLFGVLTFLGSAMLIMIPLEKVLKYVNSYIGFIICFCLFILTKNINYGALAIGNIDIVKLPDVLYSNLFTSYLGFPPKDFVSSDYFSLIPWLFLYVCGYFLFRIFKQRNLMRFLYAPRIRVLEWFGRNSLIIYMLHQPIVYVVLLVLFGS